MVHVHTDAHLLHVGTQPLGGFGHALSYGFPLGRTHPGFLLTSASTYNTNISSISGAVHAGQVVLCDVSMLVGDVMLSDVKVYVTLAGADYGARFGRSLIMTDVTGDGNDGEMQHTADALMYSIIVRVVSSTSHTCVMC